MQRVVIYIVSSVMLIVMMASPSHALSAQLTDEHISIIRSNCKSAQRVLNQIHTSDALLRVNIGREYDMLSARLMAPFNSRIVLNSLDGTGLVGITSRYDKQLDAFRSNYQIYEKEVTAALSVDCTNQPVAFYDMITSAREKRAAITRSVAALNKLIGEYSSAVDGIAASVKGMQ